MKTFIFISLMAILLSCDESPQYNYIDYKIKVDQMVLPDSIAAGDTLIVQFYGTVGPDGCHCFTHFEEHKTVDVVAITVWGTKPDFDTACSEFAVNLNGEEYKTVLNDPGLYLLKVIQPDNSILVDSVYVE